MTLDSSRGGHGISVTTVQFDGLDGCSLGGMLFTPTTTEEAPIAAVFAPGTGIRVRVYSRFLEHLASAGIPVLAFDYRGIGLSRPSTLRGFVAHFEDWAEFDTGAAIAWMKERYPESALAGVGHSLGSVLLGAAEGAGELRQIVCIGPHTGYFGDYRRSLDLTMRWGWRALVRILTPLCGYFPGRWFGGEDLPGRIAMQWSSCTEPGFQAGLVHGSPQRGRRLLAQGASLRVPTLVLSFSDDPWSTDIGVRRFLHGYPKLLAVRRVIAPHEIGKRRIGHWGFFRRSSRATLWPLVVNFLLSPGIPGGTRS
jgi:predicted alpha/beta hydrolase